MATVNNTDNGTTAIYYDVRVKVVEANSCTHCNDDSITSKVLQYQAVHLPDEDCAIGFKAWQYFFEEAVA